MKKSLLALAAMGAFAGAAQAQSSVTVYGILDVGYVGTSNRIGTSGNVPSGAPQGFDLNGNPGSVPTFSNAKTQSNGFVGNGAETTSRLGFRGTEDLGGGTSAFFTIELAIAPNSEQAISTSATQNRQTFVGVRQKGLGAVSIGTQYTPIHRAVGLTDPGQQNNVVGSVIYGAPVGNIAPGNGSTGAYTIRTNNMLFLETDTFSGFKVNAFYTQNNSNSNQTTPAGGAGSEGYRGGNNNQNGWGIGLNFTWQKLFITANYQALNSKNPYGAAVYGLGTTSSNNEPAITATTAGNPSPWVAPSGGVNAKDNQQYYAATYDFGIVKLFAGYINRKATSQIDSGDYISRTGQQIGARGFVTKTIEAWGSAGTGRLSAFGNAAPTANFNAWQLGSNYWLSKRTNLYAIYGQTITSTANLSGEQTTNGRTGFINGGVSQYAVGVRHTF